MRNQTNKRICWIPELMVQQIITEAVHHLILGISMTICHSMQCPSTLCALIKHFSCIQWWLNQHNTNARKFYWSWCQHQPSPQVMRLMGVKILTYSWRWFVKVLYDKWLLKIETTESHWCLLKHLRLSCRSAKDDYLRVVKKSLRR